MNGRATSLSSAQLVGFTGGLCFLFLSFFGGQVLTVERKKAVGAALLSSCFTEQEVRVYSVERIEQGVVLLPLDQL